MILQKSRNYESRFQGKQKQQVQLREWISKMLVY